MNRLPFEKRSQILHLMVEGNAVNGIARLTGASKHHVLRLLELAGQACMAHHDRAVRGVKAQRVECDEIWPSTTASGPIWRRPRPRPKGWRCLDLDRD